MWQVLPGASRNRSAGTGRAIVRRAGVVLVSLVVASVVLPAAASPRPQPSKADPALYAQAERHPRAEFPVVIRELEPPTSAAEGLVRSLGGRVSRELPIVGGFSADVPGDAVARLTASPDVLGVWGDARIGMSNVDMDQYDSYPVNTVWKTTINLLNALLKANGSSKDKLLTALIFITSMAEKPAMNAVWKEWLAPATLPTRATIGVSDLEKNIKIEVVVTAAKG